jgi:hypothetical protein
MTLSLSRFSGDPIGDVKESALCQSDKVYQETCPVQTMHMPMVLFGRWSQTVQITNDYDHIRQ